MPLLLTYVTIGHLYVVTDYIMNICKENVFFSFTSFEHIQPLQSRNPRVGATSKKWFSFKTLDDWVDEEVQ